jgi:hypothetical protein
MSESPPDDELRALIAMEKSALVDPAPDARARLAARLGPLLVAPPAPPPDAPPPAPPSPGLTGWKLAAAGLGTFIVGGVAGAVLHASTATPRTEVRYVDRIVSIEAGVDAGAFEPPSSAVSALPSVITSERPVRVEHPAASATPAVMTDEALARERQIIEKARSALARGDADGALGAVAEHAKTFPRGQLGEAREAIAVQALVRAGRHAEARTRADRFRRSYPGSTYAPVVDAAISSIP